MVTAQGCAPDWPDDAAESVVLARAAARRGLRFLARRCPDLLLLDECGAEIDCERLLAAELEYEAPLWTSASAGAGGCPPAGSPTGSPCLATPTPGVAAAVDGGGGGGGGGSGASAAAAAAGAARGAECAAGPQVEASAPSQARFREGSGKVQVEASAPSQLPAALRLVARCLQGDEPGARCVTVAQLSAEVDSRLWAPLITNY